MILVAPTAYKGTISASAAAEAIARGVRAFDDVIVRPLADGGNGLVDALAVLGGRVDTVGVAGPLDAPVTARILVAHRMAIVESADACGLHLVPAALRNPLNTSTVGVGELLTFAAERSDAVVMGLGGSSTIDGGIGFAHALGWRFEDATGKRLRPAAASLPDVKRVLSPDRPLAARVLALADVTTPLYGAKGAARVFGAQKGADREAIEWFDHALRSFAEAIEDSLGIGVSAIEGGGAAGGLGAALVAFAGARLVRGSEWVMNQLGIRELLPSTRLIITGEGSFDEQSRLGKVTGQLVELGAAAGKPVLIIAGSVSTEVPAHVSVATLAGRPLDEHALELLARNAASGLLRP